MVPQKWTVKNRLVTRRWNFINEYAHRKRPPRAPLKAAPPRTRGSVNPGISILLTFTHNLLLGSIINTFDKMWTDFRTTNGKIYSKNSRATFKFYQCSKNEQILHYFFSNKVRIKGGNYYFDSRRHFEFNCNQKIENKTGKKAKLIMIQIKKIINLEY